jgi:hypothetical protein
VGAVGAGQPSPSRAWRDTRPPGPSVAGRVARPVRRTRDRAGPSQAPLKLSSGLVTPSAGLLQGAALAEGRPAAGPAGPALAAGRSRCPGPVRSLVTHKRERVFVSVEDSGLGIRDPDVSMPPTTAQAELQHLIGHPGYLRHWEGRTPHLHEHTIGLDRGRPTDASSAARTLPPRLGRSGLDLGRPVRPAPGPGRAAVSPAAPPGRHPTVRPGAPGRASAAPGAGPGARCRPG